MSYTTDPKDPRLGHGTDKYPIPQHEVYLVLSEEERAKSFVRPVRRTYIHVGINGHPKFYGATYCCGCQRHLPVGEFLWDGTNEKVGS